MTRVKSAITSLMFALCGSLSAHADDWGCKVILCLANPGSPTEYAECVAPITRLYRHLAKGHAFPTCSGADFSTSRPDYEPYECPADYDLVRKSDKEAHKLRATCRSKKFQQVEDKYCHNSYGSSSNGEWVVKDGKKICGIFTRKKPNEREKPNYIDVTIENGGTRRVWY